MKVHIPVSKVCVKKQDFRVRIGANQGSALSPYLFSVVMDEVTKKTQGEVPWCLMFADDIVLVGESRKEVN